MAYIEKRKNKKGEVTAYRIRVYNGYDVNGKQMVQFKTWTPPEGMTASQIKKEVQRQAILFEEECAKGQITANIKLKAGGTVVQRVRRAKPPQHDASA